MASYEVVETHQRLDEIVLKHYGDLSQFMIVKEANPHLTQVFLRRGDPVELPPKAPIKSEEVLW